MAYVLYTPPQHNDRSFLPSSGRAQRAVGRIWGPMRTGYTQFRVDGVWRQKAVPSTFESQSVDIDIDGQPLFLQGGHWHWIREELLAEMDGIDVGEYLPAPGGLYPSGATFPGEGVYPGADA